MSKTKKLFVFLAGVFLLLLGYASYDISTKTTFPGSKPQLKERIKNNFLQADTLNSDSTVKENQPKKVE